MIKTMLKPPMLELVVELRFFSSESANFIVGTLEQIAKKNNFSNSINLGGSNIPEELKKQDPNLHYTPWIRIFHNNDKHISCFIGAKSFSISWTRDPLDDTDLFPGWSTKLSEPFLGILSNVIALKDSLDISFDNVKYRTIDTFQEEDILEKSNFTVVLNDADLTKKEMTSTIMFKKTNAQLTHNVVVSNSAKLVSQVNNATFNGSLIDITTDYVIKENDSIENIKTIIQLCHDENKQMFSSILKQDYAEQRLGAEYAQ